MLLCRFVSAWCQLVSVLWAAARFVCCACSTCVVALFYQRLAFYLFGASVDMVRSLYRCLCQRKMQPQAVGGQGGRQGEVQLCSLSTRWDLLFWCVVACNVCCEVEML